LGKIHQRDRHTDSYVAVASAAPTHCVERQKNETVSLCIAGSGFIDFDEFVAVMNAFMPEDDAEQMRQAFAMMDKDGSGKINANELKTVMRAIGEKMTDNDIDEIIREIDMDGDGEVDYQGLL